MRGRQIKTGRKPAFCARCRQAIWKLPYDRFIGEPISIEFLYPSKLPATDHDVNANKCNVEDIHVGAISANGFQFLSATTIAMENTPRTSIGLCRWNVWILKCVKLVAVKICSTFCSRWGNLCAHSRYTYPLHLSLVARLADR